MAITAAVTDQFKQDMLNGVNQPGDTYKMALYTSSATLSNATTAYTASGEVAGAGYTAGGMTLAGFTVNLSGDTAYLTWSNPSWATSTITARGALIYNSTRSNTAIAVLDFGHDVISSGGTFTVQLPAAGASSTITVT